MLPKSGCTASWPPSSLPIAHGDPTSSGAAVTVLLRPLRCTLPIGWIGGRYTTSKPMLAMRGNAFAAVAKVPCLGLPFVVPPAGGPRKHLVPGAETGQPAIHPDAVLLAAGDQFAQRILIQQLGHLGRQRRTRPGERVAGLAQRRGGLDQRVAQRRGAHRWRPAPAAGRRSADRWTVRLSPCPAFSLAVTARRQVAIGSPQPSTRNVHRPTLSGVNSP